MSSTKSKESKLKRSSEYILWQWKVMEYLALVTIFLTPLYFNLNHSLFSISAPKTILMMGLISLMIIFYAWGVISDRKLSFRFTLLHVVLGAFLFVLTLSSIFGVDPLNSFFGKWIDGINLVLIYALAIFALFLGFLIKKNKIFIRNILITSFVSSFLVAIITYTNSSWMDIFKDGSSTLGNNSYTGEYLLFNVFFGLALFLYYIGLKSHDEVVAVKTTSQKSAVGELEAVSSTYWHKVSIATGVIIMLLSQVLFNKDILLGKVSLKEVIHSPFLLFGQANAADIGILLAVLIVVSFFLIFSSKKVSKYIGLGLLALLLISSAYTGMRLVNPDSSLHKIFIEEKGVNRFVSWDIAQVSFAANPILGNGFNNFSYSYQKYFSSNVVNEATPEFYFYQPHNVVWEYASNNGVLGLLGYLALLVFTFLALFTGCEYDEKKYKNIRVALIGLLFGYFIQNLFGFDTPVTYLMLFTLVGIAVGLSKDKWTYEVIAEKQDNYKFFASVVIIASLASIVIFSILPYVEFRKMGKMITTDNLDDRMALREGIQSISVMGGVFDISYLAGKYFDLYKADINNINDSSKGKFLDEIQSTANLIERDIVYQPNDSYSHIILNSLLNMEIFVKGGVDMERWNYSYQDVNKAIALNRENPETYLQLAQTYILKEDYENVYTSIRQAIVTAPRYSKSYEYARRVLTIRPDAKFKKFVDTMSQKWGIGL